MKPVQASEGPAQSTLQDKEPQAVIVRREAERELVTWIAPSRPFKRRDRQFYVTIFSIAGIVGLVLFLAEGIMPVLLMIALTFLYYVLTTVPPEGIEYKVTTRGVRIANKLTEWPFITRFWFTRRSDQDLLILETITIPGRIEIVVDPAVKDKIQNEISAYVPFEEMPASGIERVVDWFSKKLPGNS